MVKCCVCTHKRQTCVANCLFKPHLPAEERTKFDKIKKIFGVAKIVDIINALKTEEERQNEVDRLYADSMHYISIMGKENYVCELEKQLENTKASIEDLEENHRREVAHMRSDVALQREELNHMKYLLQKKDFEIGRLGGGGGSWVGTDQVGQQGGGESSGGTQHLYGGDRVGLQDEGQQLPLTVANMPLQAVENIQQNLDVENQVGQQGGGQSSGQLSPTTQQFFAEGQQLPLTVANMPLQAVENLPPQTVENLLQNLDVENQVGQQGGGQSSGQWSPTTQQFFAKGQQLPLTVANMPLQAVENIPPQTVENLLQNLDVENQVGQQGGGQSSGQWSPTTRQHYADLYQDMYDLI